MFDINGIFDLGLKHYTTSKQLEITVINKNNAFITTISHDHKKIHTVWGNYTPQ